MCESKVLLCNLVKFPFVIVKELFLKFETGIPSSAPVQWLFLCWQTDIDPTMQQTYAMKISEMLMLLKSDKALKWLRENNYCSIVACFMCST